MTLFVDMVHPSRRHCGRARHRRLVGLLAFVLLLGAGSGFSDTPRLVTVYPDLRLAHPNIFSQIIDGIDLETRGAAISFALGSDDDLADLESWVASERPAAVIALGQRATSAVRDLGLEVPTVIGAVLSAPEDAPPHASVISLTPEPATMFAYLKALAPDVQRILVVFNAQNDAPYIEHARGAAGRMGLRLEAQPADSLGDALQAYSRFVREARPGIDAIWLLQDKTVVDDGTTLPRLVKESWTRELIVFSNNPNHVRRGVLFSALPDNVALGRILASAALAAASSGSPEGEALQYLSETLWAVNLRTARHLELTPSEAVRREIDVVFPQP